MHTNRHFSSQRAFSLTLLENKSIIVLAQTFFQSIHMHFSPASCGNSTKYAHTDIFSVHSLRFSLAPRGQVET